jgi:hypothetical protein
MLKAPTKTKAEKEAEEAEKKAAEDAAAKAAAAEASEEEAAKAAQVEGDILEEFVSGKKQGAELKAWCDEQGSLLPSVEKLVYTLLVETEKKNPDPDCAWAEQEKYGAALVPLVEDDLYNQMQVLWAIQKVRLWLRKFAVLCNGNTVLSYSLISFFSTATLWDSQS